MKPLEDYRVEVINDIILDFGVSYRSLREDLVDHVCCLVETKMESGQNFEQALLSSFDQFEQKEFGSLQETTLYLLTLKDRKMKKTTGIIGIITSVLVIAGTLFKVNHMPGASIMLVLGVVGVALAVLPMLLKISLSTESSSLTKGTLWVGYLSGVVLCLATISKIMHWPSAEVLKVVGLVGLTFIFFPLYMIKSYQTSENRLLAISKSLLILSGVVVFWGLMV